MPETSDRGTDRRAKASGERGQNQRDDRRKQRRIAATQHTAEMHDRLGAEIERSAKETRFWDSMPKTAIEGTMPTVRVVDQDSVSAILENGRGRAAMCDLAVLDFASFTSPGGGYARGTMAQEEALCTESFLYNVLSRFMGWYSENRRHNINCELYRDRALVVPKVRFEREKYHSYADVIVAAAPNARRARADYHIDDATLEKWMRGRIRLVFAIADVLGHDKLVLGAYGCGVFGWDAAVVAEMFREELASGAHAASQVIFAVPRGRFDENLEHFQHAFACFPESNPEPFVGREAAEAASRAAKSAEASADDDDEEDWRKYL